MLSLILGVALYCLGVVGPFIYEPYVGLAVYAAFTFITPQQLGIVYLKGPLLVATATVVSYLFSTNYPKKFNHFPAELKLFSVMLIGMLLGACNAYNPDLAFEHFFIYCKYCIYLLLMVNLLSSLQKIEIFNNFLILGAAWLVYRCWDLRGAGTSAFCSALTVNRPLANSLPSTFIWMTY